MTSTESAQPAVKTLSISNLGLTYATRSGEVEALRDVSLDVNEGEFVSVVGPSGCGKSSLLKMILGLQNPSAGEIRISGDAVHGPSRDVGCVFQSPVLLPWRQIRDNVLLPVDIMSLDRGAATKRADELLAMVGLRGFESRYPFELSGGMQQRAAIVRSLVHDPDLLMMDEPFAALDAMTREQMTLELQRLWMQKRKTIVLITHSISEAVLLSDRIIVMSSRPGRVVASLENPYARPREFTDLASPELSGLSKTIRECLDLAHGG